MIADRKTTIDEALVDRNEALTQDNVGKTRYIMEHNWEEEWYPMYLTFEMPLNSPLRFIIFDQLLVFFYDNDGKFHCFEYWCPHKG